MGLEEDPNHDFWRDWKVVERAELPADFRASGWVAFDYATLTDTDIEVTWAAISAILGAARNEAPTATKRTLTMVASTLEPGPQTTEVGLDFLWIPEVSPPPEALLITLDGSRSSRRRYASSSHVPKVSHQTQSTLG